VRKYVIAAVAMLLAACSKDIQNSEAVKQGVIEYLQARKAQTGLDMGMMQVDVVSVSFEKDQARATVMFRPKSGADAAGMQMAYMLERKGNRWVVQPKNEAGANPHGGAPGDSGEPANLPPNHPALPGGSAQPPAGGSLPPGHPPVDKKQ
jgi:hypothetical protein